MPDQGVVELLEVRRLLVVRLALKKELALAMMAVTLFAKTTALVLEDSVFALRSGLGKAVPLPFALTIATIPRVSALQARALA